MNIWMRLHEFWRLLPARSEGKKQTPEFKWLPFVSSQMGQIDLKVPI